MIQYLSFDHVLGFYTVVDFNYIHKKIVFQIEQ